MDTDLPRMWLLPCMACIGTGGRYHPYRRIFWPCPYCDWTPHPEVAPAIIGNRQPRKATP